MGGEIYKQELEKVRSAKKKRRFAKFEERLVAVYRGKRLRGITFITPATNQMLFG
jgi:hypothetical protein